MDLGMEDRLEAYVDHLASALQHSKWAGSLTALCSYIVGVLLPGERKSMEPIAERLDPQHTQAQYASIQGLITDSEWDHRVILKAAREYALPLMETKGGLEVWILDDTSYPKKGRHSVGVAHQYCGNLGKQANCQAAVTLSLANHFTGLPVEYRLYLPKEWTEDPGRCKVAGVPADTRFQKKWEIALDLTDNLLREGIPRAPYVADAGYGDVPAFRKALTEKGFKYVVGITKSTLIWPPGWNPMPPPPRKPGPGRPFCAMRENPECPAMRVDTFAAALPSTAWQEVTWREGTRGPMTSRFAAVRVRPVLDRTGRGNIRVIPEEEWLLIEWPEGPLEPSRYWFSTLEDDIPLEALVDQAKLRWRIGQDYEELKQEVGLGDFEGRTWRGFHHHGSLCIAAYAFLIAEQVRFSPPTRTTILGFPKSTVSVHHPRGRPASPNRAP